LTPSSISRLATGACRKCSISAWVGMAGASVGN
jgi:hypothetical protein